MDAGINNVIYMELHSGPKMANSTCGKTIVAGTIDRGSTVFWLLIKAETCHNMKYSRMLSSVVYIDLFSSVFAVVFLIIALIFQHIF